MKRLVLLAGALAAMSVLAGCATLSREQCEAGDWRSVGISDGSRGLPLSELSEHVSACAEHGISINRELYAAGRDEGLRSYCRIDRAETEGRAGRTNYNSCQGDIGVSFNLVYDAAREVHRLERDIEVAESQVDNLLERITAPSLTEAERLQLKSDITTTQWQLDSLRDKLRFAERDLRDVYSDEERRLRG